MSIGVLCWLSDPVSRLLSGVRHRVDGHSYNNEGGEWDRKRFTTFLMVSVVSPSEFARVQT